jgi:DNA end-binding protein Ku
MSKDMVSLASHILDTKAGHFDPSKFKDQYENALKALVRRKAKGKPIEPPKETEEPGNVIDLMEALRRSVQGGKTRRGSKQATPAKRVRRSPRKRKAA